MKRRARVVVSIVGLLTAAGWIGCFNPQPEPPVENSSLTSTGATGGFWITADCDRGPRSVWTTVTSGSFGSCAIVLASATR